MVLACVFIIPRSDIVLYSRRARKRAVCAGRSLPDGSAPLNLTRTPSHAAGTWVGLLTRRIGWNTHANSNPDQNANLNPNLNPDARGTVESFANPPPSTSPF